MTEKLDLPGLLDLVRGMRIWRRQDVQWHADQVFKGPALAV